MLQMNPRAGQEWRDIENDLVDTAGEEGVAGAGRGAVTHIHDPVRNTQQRGAAPEHRAPAELRDARGKMGRVKGRLRREAIPVHTQLIPRWFSGKEATYNAGDEGSIPGSGRPPEEGNGNPPQHPCLENPMDRGAWQDQSTGSRKSRT